MADPTPKSEPVQPQAPQPEEPPYDPTEPIVQKTEDGGQKSEVAVVPGGYPTTPPINPTSSKTSALAAAQVTSSTQKVQTRKPFPVWIFWILALLALATAGFFLFLWRGRVTVTVTPTEATVTVGDRSGSGRQVRTLSPGTYPVHAEAPGFVAFSGSVTLKRHGQEQVDIVLKAAPVPVRLSEQRVQFLTLDPEQASLLYLDPGAQTVYRLRFDDPAKPVIDAITPDRLEGIGTFLWSPDRQLALYRQGGDLKLYDFNRYDLVNQTVTGWPSEVKSIDWRPDGAKVAYLFADPTTGERTLIRATRDNDEAERIFNFGPTAITDPTITWSPDGKTIAVVEKNLFLFDVFSKTLKQLSVPGPITAVRWSPQSERLLFETESGQLGLIGTGGEVSQLSVPGPISRAVFSRDGQSLIHASGRGTSLKLVRIDLTTLAQTVIPTPASKDLAPDNLLLGKDDKKLFFTSAGQPYLLEL